MISRVLLLLITGLFPAWLAIAAEPVKVDRKNQPIQIKSNALATDSGKRTAIFTGKVSARQADITIYCDKLVIFYSDKEKGIEKVEAFGNVRIVQGNRTAQAGHAIYESRAGKIILEEGPRLYQGEDEISGEVITYFIDSQSSVVSGTVKVIINPNGKGQDDGT